MTLFQPGQRVLITGKTHPWKGEEGVVLSAVVRSGYWDCYCVRLDSGMKIHAESWELSPLEKEARKV